MKQTLVIIDCQQDLMDGSETEVPVWEKERVISTINQVIAKAQKEQIDMVFIRDVDVAEGKGPGFEIHKDIHVPGDAVIFDKAATNAFHGTPLLAHLKDAGIGHLVLMGCKTEYCIDTAVRTATVSGFDVTLVEDGHTTSDSKALPAEKIIAHHNATLHGHYNVEHFAMVRKAEEDLFRPAHDQYR
ncbi:isochorismatase family protein [Rossellomorea marisflavi]|uniref:Isochorismatase family protein n=1 Tax=Rossellomorea marisflavi TaxID=189381 RepID=A0A5D4RTE4_9BACI|nr:isochorismatase family protein [Rossellomorea marisflavi]TYS53036.1 isochorismatase family protein [Rossellomorea marisflavi]